MKYDLDRVIERGGTGSAKWGNYHGGSNAGPIKAVNADLTGDGPIPMWVADMDFRCAQPILDALAKRTEHGIFGYTMGTDGYFEAVIDWMQRRHNWTVERDWISTTPGIVPAVHFAVKTYCEPGDGVLIQRPVYYPFFRAITNGGCEIVSNSLVEEDGHYTMDYDDLEAKAADPKVKISVLCSPHNPVGRVWTADELRRYGEICNRHNVIVIADEIHFDLMMPGVKFEPYALLGEEFAQNALFCTAPSKTFNLAGMHLSNVITPNPELKQAYDGYMLRTGISGHLNPLVISAVEAAYREGEDWLAQVLDYVWGNFQFLKSYMAEYLPQIKVTDLQGTYLCWLDFRALGLDRAALEDLTQIRAKVLFDEGYIFGDEGEGFERINLACPRAVLELALGRLKDEIGKQ